MSRDVRLYLGAEFLRGLSFAYAVATLFYQKIGLNYTELSLLWLAMSIAQLLFEVPCGLLSDRIGHRMTLVCGFAVFVCTMMLIGGGHGFWMMFAGGFAWGISAALMSGASDAFVYEALKHAGREHDYLRVIGLRSMLLSFGIIVAAIPGAYLYTMHFRLPWFANALAIGSGMCCLLLAQSPPPAQSDGCGDGHRSNWQHVSDSLRQLIHNRPLLWLSLFTTLAVFPLYGFALIRQPYLISRQFEVAHLGYIFAAIELVSSMISWQAHRIDKAMGFSASLLFNVVCIAVSYQLLSVILNPWSLAPLAFLYAAFRFNTIVLNAYSNKHISSEQRATVLSLQSMGGSVLLIFFMLSSGYILDTLSMDVYLHVLGFYIVLVLLPLWLLRRRFGISVKEESHEG